MPDNNYNYGASYIMNYDLQSDMPKKQSKPTVEASLFKMAEDKNYFS